MRYYVAKKCYNFTKIDLRTKKMNKLEIVNDRITSGEKIIKFPGSTAVLGCDLEDFNKSYF
jgi:hypothetical protein